MIVDCAVYERGRRTMPRCTLGEVAAALSASDDAASFVWIGLMEPSAEEIDEVAGLFGLHPLAVEDAVRAHQRPKAEHFGDSVFVVLKTVRFVDSIEVVEIGEVMIFAGERFVITVRHGEAGRASGARARLEADPDRLAGGVGVVVHEISDQVVDEFLEVLSQVEGEVDQALAAVFRGPSASHAQRIFTLKREILEFRLAAVPLFDPLQTLMSTPIPGFDPGLQPYFRDVVDHLHRCSNRLDALDQLLSGALDANLAQVAMRQNEDMRKMSAWVAIISVPTAVAGLYGMNFEHMPELRWRWGYPLIVGVIAAVCFLLYRNFKQRGWL
ncbi:MAG: magnesium and cobalt transport protein CorA [Microthrixaceae bacterium]